MYLNPKKLTAATATRSWLLMWRNLITMSALGVMSWQAHAAYCLQYEWVSLTGTLIRQTHPGPPDYESVTKGDEPRVIWVLLLDQGICVVDADPRYPREYREREIQLIVQPEQYEQYENLLGKKVSASGELLPGGAKYEKRLVLMVHDMIRGRP